MDRDVKMVERVVPIEPVDIEDIKIRLVVENSASKRGHSKEKDKSAEFQDLNDLYTFNDGQSLKRRTSNRDHLNLTAENCKLESIIEQYRESNQRLKSELEEKCRNQGKSSDMMMIFKGFMEDIKTRLSMEMKEEKVEEGNVLEKVVDAMEHFEENFFRESLKEWGTYLVTLKRRQAEMSSNVNQCMEENDRLRRQFDLIDYKLKDVLRTAQVICNPECEQPVNLYMMKLELRNKIKAIEECYDGADFLSRSGLQLRKQEDGDNKENVLPNKDKRHNCSPFSNTDLNTNAEDGDSAYSVKKPMDYSRKKIGEDQKLIAQAQRMVHQKFTKLASIATQSHFEDQEIFPAIDYRKCTRCGKNDSISQGYCFYQIRCAETSEDGVFSVVSKDHMAKSHAYPIDKEPEERKGGEFMCIRRELRPINPMRNMYTQTVVGIEDVQLMNKNRLSDYKQIEAVFLSPK